MYLKIRRWIARLTFCDLDQLDTEIAADQLRVAQGVLA